MVSWRACGNWYLKRKSQGVLCVGAGTVDFAISWQYIFYCLSYEICASSLKIAVQPLSENTELPYQRPTNTWPMRPHDDPMEPQESLPAADTSPPPMAGAESDKPCAKTLQLDRRYDGSPQVRRSTARLATSAQYPPRQAQANLPWRQVTRSLRNQTSPRQITGTLRWMQPAAPHSPCQQGSSANNKPLLRQSSPRN